MKTNNFVCYGTVGFIYLFCFSYYFSCESFAFENISFKINRGFDTIHRKYVERGSATLSEMSTKYVGFLYGTVNKCIFIYSQTL